MKEWRVTYQMFPGVSSTQDDKTVWAEDEVDARKVFERLFSAFIFVGAKEV